MSDNYRFLNPYNFVRYLPEGKDNNASEIKLLGRCVPPPHDRFIGLTGRIECELEAKTPIFISDSEFVKIKKINKEEHKSYRFFRLKDENGNEKFAIPSTSLRGMIRSVFEAVTNSCFSVFEGGLLGKRERPEKYDRKMQLTAGLILKIPLGKDKPGIVRKMKYYKLPHSKFHYYKNKFEDNGKKVLVKIKNGKVIEIKENKGNNVDAYVIGYLKTSDKGLFGRTQKRNEYVFVEETPSKDFILSYETYINYIVANKNNKIPHTKVPKPGDTIWFRAHGEKIKEFGYAQIYRKPFEKSIGDLLPNYLHPCTDYNNLCPACRVFGWVHPSPPENLNFKVAYASRLKISHAELINNKGTIPEFPLAILLTPKPTTTFFYLFKNNKPDFDVTYNTPEANLRGRKFYRHQDKAKEQEYKRVNKIGDDHNRIIRDALKPGAKFKFSVEFENLAPVELGALLWTIEMDGRMFHKLGMGKPLGFGSVKISINEIKILNIKERYGSYTKDGYKKINNGKKTEWINLFKESMKEKYGKQFDELENIKDLKAILSSPNLPVHYPRTTEKPTPKGKNFEWFIQNKRQGRMPLKLANQDKEGFPLRF